MAPRGVQAHAMDGLLSQDSTGQPGLENYFSYSQQYGDYSQVAHLPHTGFLCIREYTEAN